MKKIGGGWQYVAYDMGDGRVYKKFRSFLNRFFYIYFHSRNSISNTIKESKRMKVDAENSFRIIQENKIPSSWIANPQLLNNLDYTQDKVRPLQDVFDCTDTGEGKRVVDLYIKFINNLLHLGYIDFSLRISANFGVDKDGDIVLMDLGEIIDNPCVIVEQRKARYWHYEYMSDYIKNKEVREYYQNEMDKYFGL